MTWPTPPPPPYSTPPPYDYAYGQPPPLPPPPPRQGLSVGAIVAIIIGAVSIGISGFSLAIYGLYKAGESTRDDSECTTATGSSRR